MGTTRGSLLTALGVVVWLFFRLETEIDLRFAQIPLNTYGRMALAALAAALVLWGALDIRRDPSVRGASRALPYVGVALVLAALAARIGSEQLGGQPKSELDAALVTSVGAEPLLLILGATLVLWVVATGFDRGVMVSGVLVTGLALFYAFNAPAGLIDGPVRWAQYTGRLQFFLAIAAGPLALVALLIGSREARAPSETKTKHDATVRVPVTTPAPRKPAK